MVYYKSSKPKSKSCELKTRNKSYDDGHSSNDVICTDSNITYNIGEYVLIKWNENVYPGEIISVFEESALVKCIRRGTKTLKCPNWGSKINQ